MNECGVTCLSYLVCGILNEREGGRKEGNGEITKKEEADILFPFFLSFFSLF